VAPKEREEKKTLQEFQRGESEENEGKMKNWGGREGTVANSGGPRKYKTGWVVTRNGTKHRQRRNKNENIRTLKLSRKTKNSKVLIRPIYEGERLIKDHGRLTIKLEKKRRK